MFVPVTKIFLAARYHRACINSLAETTGYFFKCPLCNNKDTFELEMKRFGVFVPEQDAAWERDSNAFDSLLERHGSCDADDCVCPEGRDFDEDYTDWEIVRLDNFNFFARASSNVPFHASRSCARVVALKAFI